MSIPHPHRQPRSLLALPALRAGAGDALALLRLWLRRSRTRHALEQLTPEQLRDTALSPAMARRESAKPFWEA